MVPLLYTDSDRALAAAGLTSDDLDDSFIKDKDLLRMLSVDLFQWLPNHNTLYVEPGSLNAPPLNAYISDCLVLYCTYFCASVVADSVLSIMAKESDGQNEYNRFSTVDFAKLKSDLHNKAGHYKQLILDQTATPPTRVTQFSVVAPSYDPVTG